MKKQLLRAPAIILTFSIFLLSSFSLDKLPSKGIFTYDKLIHIVEFAIYTFSVAIALNTCKQKTIHKFLIVIALLIGILYGGLDECHQLYVHGRSASIFDWLADTLGSVLGVYIFTKLRKFKWFHYDQAQ